MATYGFGGRSRTAAPRKTAHLNSHRVTFKLDGVEKSRNITAVSEQAAESHILSAYPKATDVRAVRTFSPPIA